MLFLLSCWTGVVDEQLEQVDITNAQLGETLELQNVADVQQVDITNVADAQLGETLELRNITDVRSADDGSELSEVSDTVYACMVLYYIHLADDAEYPGLCYIAG